MAEIGPNTRIRTSVYYEATLRDGVVAFTPYNRMLLPVSFGNPEGEYARLLNGVSLWDVAVQRQVQISGPDAARLAQVLSVRDLSNFVVGQGKYVPMCDHRGTLINDPVVLKLGDDLFWFSIADNNMLMWSRAIAAERGFDVDITEPDVSPLAVQGPKAEDVVASVFGDWIRHLKFFWFASAEIDGIALKIARSGYSKQGGFELYLMDGSRGSDLYNILCKAGAPWDIGPGYPNPVERIEGGLLSYGGDTDDDTNPFEVRLERFVDLDLGHEVIGIEALRRIHAEGPKRHQLGVILDDETPQHGHAVWFDVVVDGIKVGSMTNGSFSPRFRRMIGFVLVHRACQPGDRVMVRKYGKLVPGTLTDLPFL